MKLSDIGRIDLSRFELIYGGRFEHFVSNHAAIGKFITQHKVPVADIYTSQYGRNMEARMESQELAEKPLAIRRPDFPGGLKTPHLHYKGEIYMLTQKQWQEYSRASIATLQERMAKVNSIAFEQLMELSDTINALG